MQSYIVTILNRLCLLVITPTRAKMKKIIVFFLFYILTNYISAQSDSMLITLLTECKSIRENNFMFRENCIYGEYHNYGITDQVSDDLFAKFCVKNKNKKIYFIEGSSVYEYIFYRYKKNINYLNYNQQKIPFEDFSGIKSLLLIYDRYKNDTNIIFKSIDCDNDFMVSFLSLKDILNECNGNSDFNDENNLLNKSLDKSNIKLLKKARLLTQAFRADTLKYFKKLSIDNYKFYKNIITDLEFGIINEKMEKVKNKNKECYYYRESLMYNKIISQLNANTSFFLHIGLFHALDSVPNFYDETPWISVAERLSKKLGSENITKICLLKVTRESSFIDDLIIKKDFLNELTDKQFATPCVIDLKKLSGIKTKFAYGILYK